MPKALEEKLKKQYEKEGLRGKELNHAVYGTLTNIEKRQGNDMHGKPLKDKKKKKSSGGHNYIMSHM